jgi:hypothetical protein
MLEVRRDAHTNAARSPATHVEGESGNLAGSRQRRKVFIAIIFFILPVDCCVHRYMNLPVQFSLEQEIRKAAYILYNFTSDNAIEGSDHRLFTQAPNKLQRSHTAD